MILEVVRKWKKRYENYVKEEELKEKEREKASEKKHKEYNRIMAEQGYKRIVEDEVNSEYHPINSKPQRLQAKVSDFQFKHSELSPYPILTTTRNSRVVSPSIVRLNPVLASILRPSDELVNTPQPVSNAIPENINQNNLQNLQQDNIFSTIIIDGIPADPETPEDRQDEPYETDEESVEHPILRMPKSHLQGLKLASGLPEYNEIYKQSPFNTNARFPPVPIQMRQPLGKGIRFQLPPYTPRPQPARYRKKYIPKTFPNKSISEATLYLDSIAAAQRNLQYVFPLAVVEEQEVDPTDNQLNSFDKCDDDRKYRPYFLSMEVNPVFAEALTQKLEEFVHSPQYARRLEKYYQQDDGNFNNSNDIKNESTSEIKSNLAVGAPTQTVIAKDSISSNQPSNTQNTIPNQTENSLPVEDSNTDRAAEVENLIELESKTESKPVLKNEPTNNKDSDQINTQKEIKIQTKFENGNFGNKNGKKTKKTENETGNKKKGKSLFGLRGLANRLFSSKGSPKSSKPLKSSTSSQIKPKYDSPTSKETPQKNCQTSSHNSQTEKAVKRNGSMTNNSKKDEALGLLPVDNSVVQPESQHVLPENDNDDTENGPKQAGHINNKLTETQESLAIEQVTDKKNGIVSSSASLNLPPKEIQNALILQCKTYSF